MMTVNDVDLIMQPNDNALGFIIPPADADSCLTFQSFSDYDQVTQFLSPHTSDARLLDSDCWPPPLIFNVAYGFAALKAWGLPIFKDFAR